MYLVPITDHCILLKALMFKYNAAIICEEPAAKNILVQKIY